MTVANVLCSGQIPVTVPVTFLGSMVIKTRKQLNPDCRTRSWDSACGVGPCNTVGFTTLKSEAICPSVYRSAQEDRDSLNNGGNTDDTFFVDLQKLLRATQAIYPDTKVELKQSVQGDLNAQVSRMSLVVGTSISQVFPPLPCSLPAGRLFGQLCQRRWVACDARCKGRLLAVLRVP